MAAAVGSPRWAYPALAVGFGLLGAYVLLIDTSVGPTAYLVVAADATVLTVVGASRMPRARRRIWWALAVSQGLFLVGDTLWTLFAEVLDIEPFPSVADVFYLLQYPALALGLLWLVRGRRRGRDRAAFLDAAILTTGFTVVGTVFFVAPAAETGGTTVLSQVVAAAYPAGDLLVLALVVRMFTTGIVRNPALWALFGAVAALLVADLFYVATVVNGAAYPIWIDPCYLLSYLLLSSAVLHPSARTLSEPAPDRPERVTGARLVLLGAALMLAPLTQAVADLTGVGGNRWVPLVGGCVAAVLVVLRLGDLVQSLKRNAVQLAALARRDGLTGIANRRTWDHELSRACAHARDKGTPLSAAVLDLDHFKAFNDTYGHLQGDLVLKETAAAWASLLEGRGFVARFGGEEFTVLIPDATTDDAILLLDGMRRSVTRDQTCSIGLATWDGVESPAELVARADRALYLAKKAGRDRIALDDDGAPRVVSSHLDPGPLLQSLRTVYQPVVNLRTNSVAGWEALSRFKGSDPREVFERAERDGTAGLLEAAAIRSALAGWEGTALLALNVSPTALLTPQVHEALAGDLSRIVLEITESDLAGYSAEMMVAIDRLRERGARIAIDDLGIGFSNVRRVVSIRPEILKLDISLIRGIDANPMLQAVVAAALILAERIGSQVIAEGVETSDECACLVDLGVVYAQGFLLGMPEPAPSQARDLRSFSGPRSTDPAGHGGDPARSV